MAVSVCVFVSNAESNGSLPVCYVMGQMGDNDKSQSHSIDPNEHIHTKLSAKGVPRTTFGLTTLCQDWV